MLSPEIQANNGLIAIFMGAKYHPPTWNILNKYSNAYEFRESKIAFAPEQLLYNSNWGWLMSVVNKIEELLPNEESVLISGNTCKITPFISVTAKTKFNAVYLAVTKYILHYDPQLNKINLHNQILIQ